MNYDDLFAYVKTALLPYDSHGGIALTGIKFSRFEHTKRVYRWAMILAEDVAEAAVFFVEHRTNAVIDEIQIHRVGKAPFA